MLTVTAVDQITIREFEPGDELAFLKLNEAWITRYFVLEPKDIHSLEHPRETILDKGGRILMAMHQTTPVGCCALLTLREGEFEVAKMAVSDQFQGAGIGRRLLTHVIETARAAGATRLYLETNSILTPAVHLYHSLGFQDLGPDRATPSPYTRANLQMELILDQPEYR
jgi:N-acetylglutamate synthase-like GNAT family acetyltransferase